MPTPISNADVTLGILAGGRGTRLGGAEKAWIERDGVPQVIRWRQRFAHEVARTLVSANRYLDRYAAAGLRALADRTDTDLGPIAGLDTLAAHCQTPWLLTLPVDLVGVDDCLLSKLIAQRHPHGGFAEDEEGAQPLIALWNVEALREGAAAAIARNDTAVHRLQATLDLARVHFPGVRFGNLNAPGDLAAAGASLPETPHE